MNQFLDKILLSNEITIDWPENKLEEVISKLDEKSFRIIKLEKGSYKFVSNSSLGTAIVNGNPERIEGIKVFGEIRKESDSTAILRLTTKFRIETVFTCIFWLGMILFQIFGNQYIPIWVNLILFPVVLVWFWFVYRIQEISLMNKVEIKIKKALQHNLYVMP